MWPSGGVPVEVFAGAEVNFEPNVADLEAARTERTKAVIVTSPNNPTGAVWSEETPVEVFAGAEVNFEPNVADLEAARTERTKAVIVTSPNNPTGAVWSEETIRAIGEWAIEHGIWVVSDEIYEHLTYDGVHTTYIGAAVPEVREQLIVLNGVAKTYAMPGWRVGWMVAPERVAKAAAKLQGHMTSNVNNIAQRAALAAVSGPLDAVERMREAFDARRQAIVAALNQIDGVHCPTPKGAFYAFPDVRGLLNRPMGPNGQVFEDTAALAAALLDEAHVAAPRCSPRRMWRPCPARRSARPGICASRTRSPTTSSPRACVASRRGSPRRPLRERWMPGLDESQAVRQHTWLSP